MATITSLSVDLETFSSINLSKSGVYRYVEAPDLRFFCSVIARMAVLFRSSTLPAVKSSRLRSRRRLPMKP
jgi:hypothetical protein